MAKKKMKRAARRVGAVVRRVASVARSGGRRAARSAVGGLKARKGDLVGMAAGAAVAYGVSAMSVARAREGKTMPTVAGVQPPLLYGVVLAALGTVVPGTSKGMVGDALCGAATGQLAIAAGALAAGVPLRTTVSGEIVGDDSDDE